MAKAKVTHSTDGVMVTVKGDKNSPEPAFNIIKFPGGHVEVTRTTEGKYWVHVAVDKPSNIEDSRIDYDYEGYQCRANDNLPTIPEIPLHDRIQHMAILVNGPFKEF